MRRAATVLLAVVVLLAGVAGCREEAGRSAPEWNGRATIAVTAWPASASLFIAHEKGYFQDEGIEATLELNEPGHLGLDAVLSGKADFATAGDTPIARAAVDVKPLAVIATVGETTRVTPGAVDLLGFSPQEQGTSLREQLAMLRLETEDGQALATGGCTAAPGAAWRDGTRGRSAHPSAVRWQAPPGLYQRSAYSYPCGQTAGRRGCLH